MSNINKVEEISKNIIGAKIIKFKIIKLNKLCNMDDNGIYLYINTRKNNKNYKFIIKSPSKVCYENDFYPTVLNNNETSSFFLKNKEDIESDDFNETNNFNETDDSDDETNESDDSDDETDETDETDESDQELDQESNEESDEESNEESDEESNNLNSDESDESIDFNKFLNKITNVTMSEESDEN